MSSDEHRARRSAVQTDESQWKTAKLVRPTGRCREIETFDDYDASLEQRAMRAMVA